MFALLSEIVVWRRNTICSSFASRLLSSNSTNEKSFTVSYLINSCGLSEEKAISASNKVKFETSTNPDSVLNLFRDNGFPNTDITKIIEKMPFLLQSSVDKTLKPKFDFLKSKGLSGPELAKSLSMRPYVLSASLQESIIPSFDFLTSVVHTESKVIAILKCWTDVLRNDVHKQLAPNLAILRASGVSDSNIESLLVHHPRALLKTPSNFEKIVQEVIELGFDPSQNNFVTALRGFTTMSKSTLENKFNVYRRWGWSDEVIKCAFRKQPHCLRASTKKIEKSMELLVGKMGYDPLQLANIPNVFTYSLEKRVIPRCLVMQVLISNGFIEKNPSLYNLVVIPEEDFLKNFVSKFEGNIPGLLNVYQGKDKLSQV